VIVADIDDLFLEVHELLQLCLEVLKLRVLRVEFLQALIDLLFPEPVVAFEAVRNFFTLFLVPWIEPVSKRMTFTISLSLAIQS